jgi:maltooligosyltrehalose trehalohydrolase
MTSFRWRLPFGAELLDQERTRFRLYAPVQSAVAVEFSDGSTLPMRRGEDGWFEIEARAAAGMRYRYRLANGIRVPDPASRAQSGGVHGYSVVMDPASYQWRHAAWRGRPWHEAVIYELHAGLLGGFRGVADELPRLARLGITAVELMPVNDFAGTRNWGYDGVLPFAPAEAYGSPDDLKFLVDMAHEYALMIYLDVVYNHFGPDGNYLAHYVPHMFRSDIETPWGTAIDFRIPQVRRLFIENALYWLMEFRFDGLRFDALHAIPEPDWPSEMAQSVRATTEPGRQVHLVMEHDGNIAELLNGDFNAQWNDDGHHALHLLLTGEAGIYYRDYADHPARHLARVLAEGFAYQGEQSPYRNKRRGTKSSCLPPTAFVLFLQNHDQVGNRAFGERLTLLADRAALEAAIALQLLAPQIPLLFMGEEDASSTSFLYFIDHHPELAKLVREGREREFGDLVTSANPVSRETIPDPNDRDTFARSKPRPDPSLGAARWDYYARLLALRRQVIVPRLRESRAIGADAIGEAAVAARWRMGDEAILTIVCNLGAAATGCDAVSGHTMFESAPGTANAVRAGTAPARAMAAFLWHQR